MNSPLTPSSELQANLAYHRAGKMSPGMLLSHPGLDATEAKGIQCLCSQGD